MLGLRAADRPHFPIVVSTEVIDHHRLPGQARSLFSFSFPRVIDALCAMLSRILQSHQTSKTAHLLSVYSILQCQNEQSDAIVLRQ